MHVSPLLANLEEVPRSWQGMGNQLRNKLSNKERKKERKVNMEILHSFVS